MAKRKKRTYKDSTVLQICVDHHGAVKGGHLCAFITQWAMASQSMGRQIDINEYAEWSHMTIRNAYTQQARFREAFPHLLTPQPIADAAQQRAAGWQARGVKGMGTLPMSLVGTGEPLQTA